MYRNIAGNLTMCELKLIHAEVDFMYFFKLAPTACSAVL